MLVPFRMISAKLPLRGATHWQRQAYATDSRTTSPKPVSPFSAPQNASVEAPGSGSNVSFPQQAAAAAEELASPLVPFASLIFGPLIPDHSSSHSSTTQVPKSSSPSATGEGRISTSASDEVLPAGGPQSANKAMGASPDNLSDETIGEGLENRGLGNFKPDSHLRSHNASGKPDAKRDSVESAALKESLTHKLKQSESAALHFLERQSGIRIPSLQDAVSQLPNREAFQFEDRALNEAEQRGLYVLSGMVVVGWLLGGLAAS